MLEKSRISQIGMMEGSNISEEWRAARVGKITSSQVYKLCKKEGFGQEGMNYIRTRVFEMIAKVSSEREFTTPETINGLVEEGFGIRCFKKRHGIGDNLVVQKLVLGEDPAYSCTSDGLWIKSATETAYEVSTLEIKSFSPERHVACAEAENPADVLKIDPKTYWQVLDETNVVNCLDGYLAYWNQAMPEDQGGYREIHFRKALLRDDLKFLNTRKEQAKAEIQRIYNKLTNKT